MKGDFSRQTFDPGKHFLRVLQQQGRVQLDADWNEQMAILLHYLQTLAADIIGPFGGPSGEHLGFAIRPKIDGSDFEIGTGRYYVSGMLCEMARRFKPDESELVSTYFDQLDYPLDRTRFPLPPPPYLVYLDVWERHLTSVEDLRLREVALDGPDTASRSKVVCQVKVTNEMPGKGGGANDSIARSAAQDWTCADIKGNWRSWVDKWQPARGRLKARARPSTKPEVEACTISPEAQYRGAENQLYRVEIQKRSTGSVVTKDYRPGAFKWSRENGAVVFPILALHEVTSNALTLTTVTIAHLGRDGRFGLAPGDWVELLDDEYVLHERAEPLLQVQAIDRANLQVTLAGAPAASIDLAKHPLLRRWDQKEGSLSQAGISFEDGAIQIPADLKKLDWITADWITLENGVQIQFEPFATFRPGDYWLIPARTITGDVDWPQVPDPDDEERQLPAALPPHGVTHYYAPLAVIRSPQDFDDCRCAFEPLLCVPDGGETSLFDRPAVMRPIAPEPKPELETRPPAKAKPTSKPKARGEN